MIYILSNPKCAEVDDEITLIEDPDFIIRELEKSEKLGYDSETQGKSPYTDKIFCIQIGDLENQFVIDARLWDIRLFKKLLETKTLVGVNVKFDLRFLYHCGIRPIKVIDLMLNEINLTNGLYEINETKGKFSFKGLSEQYLGDTDIDKRIGRGFIYKPYEEPLLLEEIKYAAKDVRNPLLILKEQEKNIEKKKAKTVCDLENSFVLALADMEYNGIRLNTDKWGEIQNLVDVKYKNTINDLNQIILEQPFFSGKKIRYGKKQQPVVYEYINQSGNQVKVCGINWNAPAQVTGLLNLAGLDVNSSSKDTLILLKDEYPIVEKLLEKSKYNSLKVKFTDVLTQFINPVTGRIHTDFWQIVSTGRISSNHPNLQQIPSKGDEAKEMRTCFIPDEGESMVTSDISGAELRLIAEASQDPLWLEAFREGKDLHGVLAARLFNIPESDVRKSFPLKPDMTYRDVTKIINFGLCYGMTKFKFSNGIKISIEEAEKTINEYFSIVPLVKKYLDNSGKQGKIHGVSYTLGPIHRARYYNLKKAYSCPDNKMAILSGYERQAKNHPIQGANGDWCKMAIYMLYKYIQKNKFPAKIRLQVHDEIVSSVREDLAEEWAQIQTNTMEEAGRYFIKTIPIKVETNIATHWSK